MGLESLMIRLTIKAARGAESEWLAVGLLLLGAVQVAVAEDASAEQGRCSAQTPREASMRADQFMQQRDYQHAGECYVAAAEYDQANRAFVKTVGPAAAAGQQHIAQGVEATRAQVRKLEAALKGHQHK
jgi:hypothetical protein